MSFFKVNTSAIWATVAIILLCTALQSLPDSTQLALRYDSAAIAGGEIWRAISGHFVHLGWRHLIMNVLAAVLLAALFEQAWRAGDVLIGGLFCAVLISAGLYFFHPQVSWYVGYSGILHGLFVIASAQLLSREPTYAALLLLGVALKLGYEMLFGSAQDPEWLGGAVVEQSHFWGAVGGALYAVADRFMRPRSTAG